jgi:hypothetical protein
MLVQVFQRRQLLPAPCSPCSPEAQKNNFTAVCTQLNLFSICR